MGIIDTIALKNINPGTKRKIKMIVIGVVAAYLLFPQKLGFLTNSIVPNFPKFKWIHVIVYLLVVVLYWAYERIM